METAVSYVVCYTAVSPIWPRAVGHAASSTETLLPYVGAGWRRRRRIQACPQEWSVTHSLGVHDIV